MHLILRIDTFLKTHLDNEHFYNDLVPFPSDEMIIRQLLFSKEKQLPPFKKKKWWPLLKLPLPPPHSHPHPTTFTSRAVIQLINGLKVVKPLNFFFLHLSDIYLFFPLPPPFSEKKKIIK